MKPRLRMVRGYWQCGMLAGPNYCWAVAPTWSEAYALWNKPADGDGMGLLSPSAGPNRNGCEIRMTVFQRGTAASQER